MRQHGAVFISGNECDKLRWRAKPVAKLSKHDRCSVAYQRYFTSLSLSLCEIRGWNVYLTILDKVIHFH